MDRRRICIPLVASLVAAICASQPANASWFAGLGAGLSKNQDYDCNGCGPIGSLDDSGAGYKLFGGFQFHRNFAVVGGFAELADTDASGPAPFTDRLEVNGPYVALMGALPLGTNVELFSTLGVFRWSQDVTYNGTNGSFTGNDLTFSVGASYHFVLRSGQRIALQTEWQQFRDVGTNDYLLGHIDNYGLTTINAVFRFR